MKGLIFSVKRYSIHDGPGIRVSFFMKGCPLSCWWCHNPEGINPEPENIETINRIGDMKFLKTEVAGKYISVDEVLEILEKEKVFIEKSNGGVTFSGGEPMMQPLFLKEALCACKKKGYHTAVDTSGYFEPSALDMILPLTDLFMFDIKHPDPVRHMEYTGVSNELILDNLKRIIASGTAISLRIPVVPGINDDEEDIGNLGRLINSVKSSNIKMINLLPYHKAGSAKYRKLMKLNKMEKFSTPSRERMLQLRDYFSATGIKVKIGG